jgi:hypothetical protein
MYLLKNIELLTDNQLYSKVSARIDYVLQCAHQLHNMDYLINAEDTARSSTGI